MSEETTVLNFLEDNAFFMIPRVFIDYFKYDKDSIFVLSHLVNQYKYLKDAKQLDDQGYFFSTVDAVEDKYYINGYAQRKSVAKLEELGLITTVRKSIPRKRYFKINFKEISGIIEGTTKVPKKERKLEFYDKLNSAIDWGWENYKTSIDRMDKTTALAMYCWKKVFDGTNNKGMLWKWDSQLFGILNSWILVEKKTGPVDFNPITDYLTAQRYNDLKTELSLDLIMRHFVTWAKTQPEYAPNYRLCDPELVLEKLNNVNKRSTNA